MANKVEVRTVEVYDTWRTVEVVEIYVNDKLVASGAFGGEPEDNSRCRDYSWVDSAFAGIAEALGAEVEFTEKLVDE